MKTIIKLLIVAAIINAAARVGIAASRYYQFRDESQELVTFSANVAVAELQNRIMEKATELDVPIDVSDIQVFRDGPKTIATAAYVDEVEVFPNYIYPIKFHYNLEGFNMTTSIPEMGHHK